MSVEAFCSTAGMSRSHYYVLDKANAAPRSIKSGGRRFIFKADAAVWLREHGVGDLKTNDHPKRPRPRVVQITTSPQDVWAQMRGIGENYVFVRPLCLGIVEHMEDGVADTFVVPIDDEGVPMTEDANYLGIQHHPDDPNDDELFTVAGRLSEALQQQMAATAQKQTD